MDPSQVKAQRRHTSSVQLAFFVWAHNKSSQTVQFNQQASTFTSLEPETPRAECQRSPSLPGVVRALFHSQLTFSVLASRKKSKLAFHSTAAVALFSAGV